MYYFLFELDTRTVVCGTETWTGGGNAVHCCSLCLQLRRQHFSVGWNVQTLLLSLTIQLMHKDSFVILITMAHHIFARMWSLLFEVGEDEAGALHVDGTAFQSPQTEHGYRSTGRMDNLKDTRNWVIVHIWCTSGCCISSPSQNKTFQQCKGD